MGDAGILTPVPLNGPFKEFFAAWLAAYTATNEPYKMLPAVEDDLCDCEPVSGDANDVHHEQCVNLRVLYEGDLSGLANAINSLFPNNTLGQWNIHTPETWPQDRCSCSLWHQLPTSKNTDWLADTTEPDYDFQAMDSVVHDIRKAKDALRKGICDPCHMQPTDSTIPDPLQTPDPEV